MSRPKLYAQRRDNFINYKTSYFVKWTLYLIYFGFGTLTIGYLPLMVPSSNGKIPTIYATSLLATLIPSVIIIFIFAIHRPTYDLKFKIVLTIAIIPLLVILILENYWNVYTIP